MFTERNSTCIKGGNQQRRNAVQNDATANAMP
jgi:hypothetical protein